LLLKCAGVLALLIHYGTKSRQFGETQDERQGKAVPRLHVRPRASAEVSGRQLFHRRFLCDDYRRGSRRARALVHRRFFGPGIELQTFETIRVGAIAGVCIGAAAMAFLAVSAIFQRAEAVSRAYYILGGAAGIAVLVAADLMFTDDIRVFLSGYSPLWP
jgi:uncharacterized membrane protein YuzA (DUF378 family)